MKNKEKWYPTKFIYKNGKLVSSDNSKEVSLASRINVDLLAEKFDNHLKKYVSGDLADLGCGKVPLYHAYEPFVKSITCVDWHHSIHDINHFLDVICDLNDDLPISDENFDTVILSDVLEHIFEPNRLIREINRILRPKGKLIITVPFYYWIHEAPHDYFRYTRYTLFKMAEMNGFKVLFFESTGGALEVLFDVFSKTINLSKRKLAKKTILLLYHFYWIIAKTKFGKKVKNRTREIFPLEYFIVLEKDE